VPADAIGRSFPPTVTWYCTILHSSRGRAARLVVRSQRASRQGGLHSPWSCDARSPYTEPSHSSDRLWRLKMAAPNVQSFRRRAAIRANAAAPTPSRELHQQQPQYSHFTSALRCTSSHYVFKFRGRPPLSRALSRSPSLPRHVPVVRREVPPRARARASPHFHVHSNPPHLPGPKRDVHAGPCGNGEGVREEDGRGHGFRGGGEANKVVLIVGRQAFAESRGGWGDKLCIRLDR
jgi:hypothetical protein